MFLLGLLVNPLAGLGGSVALKGSDGVAELALSKGAVPRAMARAATVLEGLKPWCDQIEVLTASGDMGSAMAESAGFRTRCVYDAAVPTTSNDTQRAAEQLLAAHVDLLLFAGGDGTARDVASVVGLKVPVLGIPAGVKMQSGVFAVTPHAATELVSLMIAGELVLVDKAEVRDIDEAALRTGKVASRYYAEMRVPSEGRYIQQVKCNGREVEELVLQEIAAEVTEQMQPDITYFVGPGTTTAAVMQALSLPNTLLGVDVVKEGELLVPDADAAALESFCEQGPCQIIMTATGGQGMLLGRGNQQFSAKVLTAVGREGLIVLATNEKLTALQGRPLLMDLPDESLVPVFSGFIEVISGYQHRVLYRLSTEG